MSTDKDTVETVEKLLAERRKIAGWLDGLRARESSTPPAVYQRVFDDYTAKLQKVQGKLVAASDAVQVAAADVATRLTDKEEQLAAKRDERAEAELRAAVGEFSEREWEKRRTRLDDELAAVTTERDALRDELGRLRAVLDDVAAKDAAPEPSEMPESADRTGETAATPVATSEAPAAEDASPFAAFESAMSAEVAAVTPADPAMAVAEPAVTEPMEEAAAAPMPPTEAEPIAAESSSAVTPVVSLEPVPAPVIPIHEQSIIAPVDAAQPLAPSFDELAFLNSVVGRNTPAKSNARRTPPQPMPAIIEDRPDDEAAPRDARAYAVPEPPTPFPDPVPEPRVSQEMTPPRESFFGRPTPRTSEAVKSLRCQECGTLNYPTEWYCERCGGELAAL